MPSKQALDYGKLGSKYGDRGGRPSSKGKPLGMATIEYDEIVAFLNSKQSAPIYPFSLSSMIIYSRSFTSGFLIT